MLGQEKDCTLSKWITNYGFKGFKTRDEAMRISKQIFDEVWTGLLVNDASDA